MATTNTPALPVIKWQQADFERREQMAVEFIGGPFDGTRLFLHLVREGPGRFRVLEMRYEGDDEVMPA